MSSESVLNELAAVLRGPSPTTARPHSQGVVRYDIPGGGYLLVPKALISGPAPKDFDRAAWIIASVVVLVGLAAVVALALAGWAAVA